MSEDEKKIIKRYNSRQRDREILKEEAFMFWVNMGGGASNSIMGAVAVHSHRSLRTIKQWYSDGDWRDRYAAMAGNILEPELQEKMSETPVIVDSIIKDEGDVIRIIDEAMRQWFVLLSLNKIVLNRVSDLDKLVKLRLLLSGKPTSRGITLQIVTAVPRPEVIDMGKAKTDPSEMLPSELGTDLKTLPMEVNSARE